MAGRDIIVIGASAGGIEPLRDIVGLLPPDLPATVFIAVHIMPDSVSLLPDILGRAGPLPAAHCADGSAITPGKICIAPPDFHLILHDGQLRLSRGPRENNSRPSIDVLFRSAARWYGPRVIGVVLSGNLDDGTAGLVAIKSLGGVAIVQNPREAQFPSMPQSALATLTPDAVLSAREIGARLAELAREPLPAGRAESAPPAMMHEVRIAEASMQDETKTEELLPPGNPAPYSCPECNGTLFEIKDHRMTRYRCRVGHAYSPETLLSDKARSVEDALWTALRALEESESLSLRLARRTTPSNPGLSERFLARAREARRHAASLKHLLEHNKMPASDRSAAADASPEKGCVSPAPPRAPSPTE